VVITWHEHGGALWTGDAPDDLRALAFIDVVYADLEAQRVVSHVRMRVSPDESTLSGGH
jgi:hypothetical protein